LLVFVLWGQERKEEDEKEEDEKEEEEEGCVVRKQLTVGRTDTKWCYYYYGFETK